MYCVEWFKCICYWGIFIDLFHSKWDLPGTLQIVNIALKRISPKQLVNLVLQLRFLFLSIRLTPTLSKPADGKSSISPYCHISQLKRVTASELTNLMGSYLYPCQSVCTCLYCGVSTTQSNRDVSQRWGSFIRHVMYAVKGLWFACLFMQYNVYTPSICSDTNVNNINTWRDVPWIKMFFFLNLGIVIFIFNVFRNHGCLTI